MKPKIGLLLVSFAVFALVQPAVGALRSQTSTTESPAPAGSPAVSQRCNRLTNEIEARIRRYELNHTAHVETYKGVKIRAQNIVDKLEGKGYDLAEIQTDLLTLKSYIDVFEKDYADYIAKLAEAKGFVCGQSEGQFVAKLKDARDALKKVNQDAAVIRNYYKEVLRPDIKTLRDRVARKAVDEDAMAQELLQQDAVKK